MSLISLDYVKTNFPLWSSYFLDAEQAASDTVLQNEITLSEDRLLEYVAVTEDTITPQLKLHLLNIVKKRGFDLCHGDTEFTDRPQIVKDYEETIKLLEKYKSGEYSLAGINPAAVNTVSVTAKERRFNEWFTGPGNPPDPYA